VEQLEELVQDKLRPDVTLLLDAPTSVGMSRARGRGELDRFEQEDLDFFERVRGSYLEQAKNDSGRYRLINASVSLDNVQQQLLEVGGELLSRWRERSSES
jgi:dTMP kinase